MTTLKRVAFTEAALPMVQQFDCGGEIWQMEVSNWLKAPHGEDGALNAVANASAAVWLYLDAANELVGFGSLAEGWQSWPKSNDDKIEVSVIPFMGVDKKYWHKPHGSWEQRYGAQIVRDLVTEASKYRDSRPILKLVVYEKNESAIKLYRRIGFVEYHKPYCDKSNGLLYKRMALAL